MTQQRFISLFTLVIALVASTTALAVVRMPWQLDPAFNHGEGSVVLASTWPSDADAVRLDFDGDTTVVARLIPAGSQHHIQLLRYDRDGQPEAWPGSGQEIRTITPEAGTDIVAVRDILLAPDRGRMFILADVRKLADNPHGMVDTSLWDWSSSDAPNIPGMIFHPGNDPLANDVGVRLARLGNRLYVLYDNRRLAGQDASFVHDGVEIHLAAMQIGDHAIGGWDTAWGSNGRRA